MCQVLGVVLAGNNTDDDLRSRGESYKRKHAILSEIRKLVDPKNNEGCILRLIELLEEQKCWTKEANDLEKEWVKQTLSEQREELIKKKEELLLKISNSTLAEEMNAQIEEMSQHLMEAGRKLKDEGLSY